MRVFHLLRDQRGLSAVEFALAAPVLFSIIIGAAQMGILFFANTGLQHAVGEGARLAMVFPRPAPATIIQSVKDARYGLNPAHLIGEPTIDYGCEDEADYADVSWSYNAPLNFIFFETPPVKLTHSRRVFLQPAADGTTECETDTDAGEDADTGSDGTTGTGSGGTSTSGGTTTPTATGGTTTPTTTGGTTTPTTTGGTTTPTTTGGTDTPTTTGGTTTPTTTGGTDTPTTGSNGGGHASSGGSNASSGGSNGKGSDKIKGK